MSILYNPFLAQCLASFVPCPPTINGSLCSFDSQCDGNCRSVSNCKSCLTNIFRNQTHRSRTYNCLPITYTYTLRFLNVYASEIYHILSQCKILISQLDNKNIISIGCGPATELIAIEKVLRDNKISSNCNYFGFDQNSIWQSQNSCLSCLFTLNHSIPNPTFSTSCFNHNNPLLNDTKLIILNYVISDIYKHAPSTTTPTAYVSLFFNNTLTPIFHAMPTDACILINDVNSCHMGRNETETWIDSLASFSSKTYKGYFAYPGRCSSIKFNHPSICMSSNLFVFPKINPLLSRWQLNINECRSAFALIKK